MSGSCGTVAAVAARAADGDTSTTPACIAAIHLKIGAPRAKELTASNTSGGIGGGSSSSLTRAPAGMSGGSSSDLTLRFLEDVVGGCGAAACAADARTTCSAASSAVAK